MVEESVNRKVHLIQILVDQASPESFFRLIDEGAAPHISKYILGEKKKDNTYSNATISRNIVTGYPSTSANSHTSIITGSYARKNNLLYTTFWDFTGKIPKFTNVEKISLSGLKDMNRKHINPLCKTLFEHSDSSASFHAINRGADFKLLTTKSIIFKFLPLLLKLKKMGSKEGIDPMLMPEFWRRLFEDNIASFLQKIKEENEAPMATFIVYLFTDEIGHKHGFNSIQYKEAIELLDYLIKCIVEGFNDKKGRHVQGLKELGYLDSILWNFCTDHAGRRIYKDKIIVINSLAKIELGLNILEGEDEGLEKLFKKDFASINACSVVGGELWHCWFNSNDGKITQDFRFFHGERLFRELKPKKWKGKPEKENKSIDLIKYMIEQEYIQFVIIPEEDLSKKPFRLTPEQWIDSLIPREYDLKIFSSKGAAIIKRIQEDGEVLYNYDVLNGQDPLNHDKINIEHGSFHSHKEWLEKTLTHDLPDVFHRLYGFFDCIHAPNFIATSSKDYHFISINKIKKKGEKCFMDFQTHDGLFREESMVPLTLAGPGIKKGVEIRMGRNIDILPTLLKVLGLEFDKNKIDGEILFDALELNFRR